MVGAVATVAMVARGGLEDSKVNGADWLPGRTVCGCVGRLLGGQLTGPCASVPCTASYHVLVEYHVGYLSFYLRAGRPSAVSLIHYFP